MLLWQCRRDNVYQVLQNFSSACGIGSSLWQYAWHFTLLLLQIFVSVSVT